MESNENYSDKVHWTIESQNQITNRISENLNYY